jgi:hypothetical protein
LYGMFFFTKLHRCFLSGEFTTMAVINPPERKLAKRTSVNWPEEKWTLIKH